jgi:hypothetical protein
VSFSELDIFANKEKLRDGEDDEEEEESQGRYGYVEEEEEEDEEDELDVDQYYGDLHEAAHIAGDVQEDQQYGFQNIDGDHGRDSPRAEGDGGYSPERKYGPPQPLTKEELKQQAADTRAQRRERVRIIAKLRRRNAKLPVEEREPIDEHAPISELRTQAEGASYESKAKAAVLMMRRVTMFLSKFIEAGSRRYPKYFKDLEGWSESVYLSLDQYDDMLYDIYDEYGDQMQGNPIVVYLFALGTNAVMYAFARKIINNPVAGAMMNNLASALNNANNNKKSFVAGNTAVGGNRSSVTPATDGPAVPVVANTDAGEGAPDVMKTLSSLFSGGDIGDMLGGLDFSQLLSGLGDLDNNKGAIRTGAVPDYRGESIPEEAHVDEIKVNPMSGVSEEENRRVMSMLRKQEDRVKVLKSETKMMDYDTSSASGVKLPLSDPPSSVRIVNDTKQGGIRATQVGSRLTYK